MSAHRTVLAQLMSERHWTKEDVERKFEEAGQELKERGETKENASVSPRQLGRWLTGTDVLPRPIARRILEYLFQQPVAVLLGPPVQHDAAVATHQVSIPSDGPSGPGTLWSPPTASNLRLIGQAAQRARNFGIIIGRSSMADEVVEQLHQDLWQLGEMYQRVPLGEILPDLVDTQDSLFGLLEARRSPNQARQLYFLAGVAGGLLAKASHDLAEPHTALTQARTAFLCAQQADHRGLMSWLRNLQSLISYWAGRPSESLRYAESAELIASDSAGTAGVWALLSQARAASVVGNAATALAAIDRAEAARDRVVLDDLDEIGGLFTFGRIRQLYYAGEALSWLPDEAGRAADYSARAVAGYRDEEAPEWAFGDQAGSHASLAVARIAQGEIEGAAEALSPVLSLPSSKRANGIVLSARRVQGLLDGRDAPSAELREAIESFSRTPIGAITR